MGSCRRRPSACCSAGWAVFRWALCVANVLGAARGKKIHGGGRRSRCGGIKNVRLELVTKCAFRGGTKTGGARSLGGGIRRDSGARSGRRHGGLRCRAALRTKFAFFRERRI